MNQTGFYTLETLDFHVIKGDVKLIGISFTNKDKSPIDVSGYGVKFSLEDPITKDIVELISGTTTHSLEHTQGAATGNGIHLSTDTDLAALGLTIPASNSLIIKLDAADTIVLREMTYLWDLELSSDFFQRKDTIPGRLIVGKGITV